MIRVVARVGADGALRELRAAGHATRNGEISATCAAATVLLRTAAETLHRGAGATVTTTGPGDLRVGVFPAEGDLAFWISGVRDFLFQGLRDLADDDAEVDFSIEQGD